MFNCGRCDVVVGEFDFVEEHFEFTELVDGFRDREGGVDFGVGVFTCW